MTPSAPGIAASVTAPPARNAPTTEPTKNQRPRLNVSLRMAHPFAWEAVSHVLLQRLRLAVGTATPQAEQRSQTLSPWGDTCQERDCLRSNRASRCSRGRPRTASLERPIAPIVINSSRSKHTVLALTPRGERDAEIAARHRRMVSMYSRRPLVLS